MGTLKGKLRISNLIQLYGGKKLTLASLSRINWITSNHLVLKGCYCQTQLAEGG
jgi:hypothetical protein